MNDQLKADLKVAEDLIERTGPEKVESALRANFTALMENQELQQQKFMLVVAFTNELLPLIYDSGVDKFLVVDRVAELANLMAEKIMLQQHHRFTFIKQELRKAHDLENYRKELVAKYEEMKKEHS